jgi:hypothetical protein
VARGDSAGSNNGVSTNGGRKTSLPPLAIERTLDVLIMERGALRERLADSALLEENRKAICFWQRELAEARRITRR